MPPSIVKTVRTYPYLRSVLISYGVGAYGYLFWRHSQGEGAPILGGGWSSHNVVLIGLLLQILLVATRFAIKRYVTEGAAANRAMDTIDTIADGVTVLLFALGTFGQVLGRASAI